MKTSVDGGKTWDHHPKPGTTEPCKPIHPATIRLFQMATTSDLRDATHGTTLGELRFKPNENLGAFRKSTHLYRKARVVEDSPVTSKPELTPRAKKVVAEIFDRFSVQHPGGERAMTLETCVEFTRACTGSTSSPDDPRVTQFLRAYDVSGAGAVSLGQLERFFIDACVDGQDLTLRQNFGRLGYSPSLQRLPQDGDAADILQTRSGLEQMPRYKVAENQGQFNSLVAVLGHDGEVGQRALEVLRMLATNPVLHRKVLSLSGTGCGGVFSWSEIFDDSNVHKMLYSLEIVEAILVRDEDEHESREWIKRFVTLGGL